MKALLQRLATLDPRVLLILLGSVAFVALFQSWVVLRGPWAELQLLEQTRSRLELASQRDAGSAAELERLEREMVVVDRGLGGGLLRTDEAMVPYLITTLDAVASRHGVAFGGVKPPQQRSIGPFEEAGFQVEARGRYQALFAWLAEAMEEVKPLIPTELAFKSIDDGERVALSVRLAAYRIAPAASAASGAAR